MHEIFRRKILLQYQLEFKVSFKKKSLLSPLTICFRIGPAFSPLPERIYQSNWNISGIKNKQAKDCC